MGVVRPEEIYETVFDDAAFARLPDLLSRAGGGRSALLHWRHRDGGFETLAYSHFTPEFMAAYDREMRQTDLWVNAVLDRPDRNRVFVMDRIVPTRVFENSLCWEQLRGWGDDTLQALGVAISTPWGDGLIGVHRGKRQKGFDEDNARSLESVLNHLTRVLNVRGEIIAHRRGQSLAQASLDLFGQAAMVVSRRRRVVQANAAADAVLCRGDGLGVRAGELVCAAHADTQALRGLVEAATDAASPSGGAVSIQRAAGQAPYLVTVSPLVGGARSGMALVLFRDPDAVDDTLANRLRSFFGLTPSEATIAADLGRARSTDQIIASRGVSRNTLKTQLRSVATKMGLSRLSEIAATVAALPPLNER